MVLAEETLFVENDNDLLLSPTSNANNIHTAVKCKTIAESDDNVAVSTLVVFSLQNKSLKNIHVSKFYVNNAFIPVNLTIAPNGSINVGKHFRGYIDVGNALWRVSSTIGY